VYAILAAHIGREKTDAVSTSTPHSSKRRSHSQSGYFRILGTGRVPTPLGTANRFSAPYQAVKAKDTYFVMGANSNKLWQSLCEIIVRPDLGKDSRFANISGRLANRPALIEELEKSFAVKPASEWIDVLLAAGIPAGPILNYQEALDSDHARAREAVMEIEHPVEGTVKSIGFPVKLSESKQRIRMPPRFLASILMKFWPNSD